jgi:hypothetical protein
MDITYKGGLFIPGQLPPWNKGKKGLYTPTKETRQKMSDAKKGMVGNFTGQTHTEETRQRISDAKKGKPSPKKGTKGLQTHSKETRQKMSESHKGQVPWNKGKKMPPFSKEHRQKMSDAKKGKPSPRIGKYLPDDQVSKQALYNRKYRERQRQINSIS